MAEQQITLKKQRLPFTQVSNELLCTDKISGLAKALWCVLFSKPDNWTFYWNEILTNFKEGKKALRTAKKELEKAGYLLSKQKKILTGRGKEWVWGGMEMSLFHTPSTQENQGSSPDTLCGDAGDGNAGSGNSGGENAGDGNTDKDLDKKDLSKKDLLKKFLSLPPEEKKEFLRKVWLEKKFKSDYEEYFIFREKSKKQGWDSVGNLDADFSWWEKGHKKKYPELHEEKKELPKTKSIEEPEEIKQIRSDIKGAICRDNEKGFQDHHNFFEGRPIQKSGPGYKIIVEDERAFRYEGVLKQVKVEIEKV